MYLIISLHQFWCMNDRKLAWWRLIVQLWKSLYRLNTRSYFTFAEDYHYMRHKRLEYTVRYNSGPLIKQGGMLKVNIGMQCENHSIFAHAWMIFMSANPSILSIAQILPGTFCVWPRSQNAIGGSGKINVHGQKLLISAAIELHPSRTNQGSCSPNCQLKPAPSASSTIWQCSITLFIDSPFRRIANRRRCCLKQPDHSDKIN